ncbi:MAG: AAA family ATPase, partial [Candidatus Omnitrophica bacterium]|nr:AAA family ATPase [Candidatus Omnitrophota bacterium]
RLVRDDRQKVRSLFIKHRLISPDDALDFVYDFEEKDGHIKIVERRRPVQKQVPIKNKDGEVTGFEMKEFILGTPRVVFEGVMPRSIAEQFPKFIQSEAARRQVAQVIDSLEVEEGKRFNPVLEFGLTAGAKSTVASVVSYVLGSGYTRIQFNERTDEFDLFGSFQPREVKMSLEDALATLNEAVKTNNFNVLEDALVRLKMGKRGDYLEGFLPELTEAKRAEIRAMSRDDRNKWVKQDVARRISMIMMDRSSDEKIKKIKSMAYMLHNEIGLVYEEGRFLKAYRRGDLILLDEINLANEELIGVLYQMLTMGYLEHNGEVIEPAPGTIPRIIATANPSSYSGRNRMSEAFTNRFEILNVDSMSPHEMANIVQSLIERDGKTLSDYGVTFQDLEQFGKVQDTFNGLLMTGGFSRMGSESHYMFTIRNLLRIYEDVRERKARGLPVNLNTWVKEAYREYGGVLMRSPVYIDSLEELKGTPELKEDDPKFKRGDPDYKTIRNVFSLFVPWEEFDAMAQESMNDLNDYNYDAAKKEITLGGMVTSHTPLPGEAAAASNKISLIDVPSLHQIQIQLLKAIRRNEPVLLVGQSGGGKTEAVGDLAGKLGRKHVTVSLGDATLESLLGTMEYDRTEHRFIYRKGILVQAMEEGSLLVLEEINMAKSGVLEILNEYFDEGTFTNPFTGEKVVIHPEFRLMATMNPIEGMTGENTARLNLSPALRNRMREIWVPSDKSDQELKMIIEGRFNEAGVRSAKVDAIINVYRAYQKQFGRRMSEVYFTSIRDLSRIVRFMAYGMTELGQSEEVALARAIRRVYESRMTNAEDREAIHNLMQQTGISQIGEGRVRYEKDNNGILHFFEGDQPIAKFNLNLMTHLKEEQEKLEAKLVESPGLLRNMADLAEALAVSDDDVQKGAFNPVMLLGETAVAKSSLARYFATSVVGQNHTRIQMNERIDELDLLGSYEPREVKMSFEEALRVLRQSMARGDWVKLRKAADAMKTGAIPQEDLKTQPLSALRARKTEADLEVAELLEGWIVNALKGSQDPGSLEEAKKKIVNLGFLMRNGVMNVDLEFREGRLLKAIKNGDAVVLDEINLANEEVLGVLYQFLTLGYLEYYDRDAQKIVKIYPKQGFKFIATANPATYAGRNRFSEALMNRFEIHYVQPMTPEEMAEIVSKEWGEKEVSNAVFLKLSKLQKEFNDLLKQGKFQGLDASDPSKGYQFTLRNLKKIAKDAQLVLRAGDSSPPGDVLIREAYQNYLNILGRSEENIKLLDEQFTSAGLKSAHAPVSVQSLLKNISFKGSDEANVIEELEQGSETARIQYAISKGLLDPKATVCLVGQTGGGKTEMIGDLARRLGWKYRSVSFGNANLESLVGGFEMDENTKKMHYVMGALVKAMKEGAIFVIEEVNMATPGLIEILNEYFDEGTFTNPMTGEKLSIQNGGIHPDFRLFFTMNPEQGLTSASGGRVGLSPALRSRFNEVWVPHIKPKDEVVRIIQKKFANRSTKVSGATVENIYRIFDTFRQYVEGDKEGGRKLGAVNNEGYVTSLRDVGRIVDIMSRDLSMGISEDEALRHAVKRVYFLRLNSDADRKVFQDEIAIGLDMNRESYEWQELPNMWIVKRGTTEIAQFSKTDLKEKGFVLTPEARVLMADLMDTMLHGQVKGWDKGKKFHPVMLLGETAGGKSTMAEMVAVALKQEFQRIQMNQRTDEYDLFGSFHPVEMEMDDAKAASVLIEILEKGEWVKAKRTLAKMKVAEPEMHTALGADYKDVAGYDLIKAYITDYLLKAGVRGESPTARKRLHDMAIVLMNGLTGIDLKFKTGVFLESLGDRDRRVPGKVVLLDEVNLANEEAIGVLYQLLTLGYVEFQGRRIYPGEGFQLIVSGNPSNYAGRNRMSEAFMNRFEIHQVREMTVPEMTMILMQKFNLARSGIKEADVKRLVEMQKKINEMAQKGNFESFNEDGSYRFSIRNLEKIMDDAKQAHLVNAQTPLWDQILRAAWQEYSGLLSQSTEEDDFKDNNLLKLRNLFSSELGVPLDAKEKTIREEQMEYKLRHTEIEKSDYVEMNGVRVKKLPPGTATQARRIEKLTELKSMANVRTQILKGFRDGAVREEKDSKGRVYLAHRSKPVLLTGHSGGGKTEMIGDLARDLNWPYMSVALGSTTIEKLIGSFELDESTGTLVFKKGILIQAMEGGYVLVLEEVNMAEAGVIEVLNDYFDRGVITIPEKGSIPVNIHPNFRLFATMNPLEGRTGMNAGRIGLSPALRSRFREVWVRGERRKDEMYRIMLGGITALVGEVIKSGKVPEVTDEVILPESVISAESGIQRLSEAPGSRITQASTMPVLSGMTAPPTTVFTERPFKEIKASGAKAPEVPSEREWRAMSKADRIKTFSEIFQSVSEGLMNIEVSEQADTWGYQPKSNTVIVPYKAIDPANEEFESLECVIGTAIHESMHRYATWYLSLFGKFITDPVAAQIFNILEDGRIENWAKHRFKLAARYLKKMNDEVVFKNEDINELFKVEHSYTRLIANLFLWLGKRGDFQDSPEKLNQILEIIGRKSPELKADMEQLIASGVLGGGSDDEIFGKFKRRQNRGVFAKIPAMLNDLGEPRVATELRQGDPKIQEMAREQGELIKTIILPKVYKWAVRDVQEPSIKSIQDFGGTPGDQPDQPGKPGKPQARPMSDKDHEKIYDALNPAAKEKVAKDINESPAGNAKDRTKGDAKDYQDALQDAKNFEPRSERDNLMRWLGPIITAMTGYLRDLIQNSLRPKEVTGKKKGRIDIRRLMNSMARGFTNLRFYKQKELPQKKNIKFYLVMDQSGSMAGIPGNSEKDKLTHAGMAGYNCLKGGVVFMEVLQNLGIDFAVRGYGSTTHLHKKFKGQKTDRDDLLPGAAEIQSSYATRKEKEDLVQKLYENIGAHGGNEELNAFVRTMNDIKNSGAEKVFVLVLTDGMGEVPQIEKFLEELRKKNGMVGSTKVEFIGIGLGNSTEEVPKVYGSKYSFFLHDDEISKLPEAMKSTLENAIRGAYTPGADQGGTARLMSFGREVATGASLGAGVDLFPRPLEGEGSLPAEGVVVGVSVEGASLGIQQEYEASELRQELGLSLDDLASKYPEFMRILGTLTNYPDHYFAYEAFLILMKFGNEPLIQRLEKWSTLMMLIWEKSPKDPGHVYSELGKLTKSVLSGKAPESLMNIEFLKFIVERAENRSDYAYMALHMLGRAVALGNVPESVLDLEFLKMIADKAGSESGHIYETLLELGLLSVESKDKLKISDAIEICKTLGQTRNDGSIVSWEDVKVKLEQLKKDWKAEIEREASAPPAVEKPGASEEDWLARKGAVTDLPADGSVEGASLGTRENFDKSEFPRLLGMSWSELNQKYPRFTQILDEKKLADDAFWQIMQIRRESDLQPRGFFQWIRSWFQPMAAQREYSRQQLAQWSPLIVAIAEIMGTHADQAYSALIDLAREEQDRILLVRVNMMEPEYIKEVMRRTRENMDLAFIILKETVKATHLQQIVEGELEKRKQELLDTFGTLYQTRNDGTIVSPQDIRDKFEQMKRDWDREYSRRQAEIKDAEEEDWLTRQSISGGLARVTPGTGPVTGASLGKSHVMVMAKLHFGAALRLPLVITGILLRLPIVLVWIVQDFFSSFTPGSRLSLLNRIKSIVAFATSYLFFDRQYLELLFETWGYNKYDDEIRARKYMVILARGVKFGYADKKIYDLDLLKTIVEKAGKNTHDTFQQLRWLGESVKEGESSESLIDKKFLKFLVEKTGEKSWWVFRGLRRLGESVKAGKASESLIDKEFLKFLVERSKENSGDVFTGLQFGFGEFVKAGKVPESLMDKEFLKFIAEKAGMSLSDAMYQIESLGILVKKGESPENLIDKEFLKFLAEKLGEKSHEVFGGLRGWGELVKKGKGKFKIEDVIREYKTLGQIRNDGSVVSWEDVRVKLWQLGDDWRAELEREKSAPPSAEQPGGEDWLARVPVIPAGVYPGPRSGEPGSRVFGKLLDSGSRTPSGRLLSGMTTEKIAGLPADGAAEGASLGAREQFEKIVNVKSRKGPLSSEEISKIEKLFSVIRTSDPRFYDIDYDRLGDIASGVASGDLPELILDVDLLSAISLNAREKTSEAYATLYGFAQAIRLGKISRKLMSVEFLKAITEKAAPGATARVFLELQRFAEDVKAGKVNERLLNLELLKSVLSGWGGFGVPLNELRNFSHSSISAKITTGALVKFVERSRSREFAYAPLKILSKLDPQMSDEEATVQMERLARVSEKVIQAQDADTIGVLKIYDVLFRLLNFSVHFQGGESQEYFNASEVISILETLGQTRNDGSVVSLNDITIKLDQLEKDWTVKLERENAAPPAAEKPGGEADWLARVHVTGASLGAQEKYEAFEFSKLPGLAWKDLDPQLKEALVIRENAFNALEALVMASRVTGLKSSADAFRLWTPLITKVYINGEKMIAHFQNKSIPLFHTIDCFDELAAIGQAVAAGRADPKILNPDLLISVVDKVSVTSANEVYREWLQLAKSVTAGKAMESSLDPDLLKIPLDYIARGDASVMVGAMRVLSECVKAGKADEAMIKKEFFAKTIKFDRSDSYIRDFFDAIFALGNAALAGKTGDDLIRPELFLIPKADPVFLDSELIYHIIKKFGLQSGSFFRSFNDWNRTRAQGLMTKGFLIALVDNSKRSQDVKKCFESLYALRLNIERNKALQVLWDIDLLTMIIQHAQGFSKGAFRALAGFENIPQDPEFLNLLKIIAENTTPWTMGDVYIALNGLIPIWNLELLKRVAENSGGSDVASAYSELEYLGMAAGKGEIDRKILDKDFLLKIAEKSGPITSFAFWFWAGVDPRLSKAELTSMASRLGEAMGKIRSGKFGVGLLYNVIQALRSPTDDRNRKYYIREHKIPEILEILETLGQTRNDESVVSLEDVEVKLEQLAKDWTAQIEREKSAPPAAEQDWLTRVMPGAGPVRGASLGTKEKYETSDLPRELALSWNDFEKKYVDLARLFNRQVRAFEAFAALMSIGHEPADKKLNRWSPLLLAISNKEKSHVGAAFLALENLAQAVAAGYAGVEIVNFDIFETILEKGGGGISIAFESLATLAQEVTKRNVDPRVLNEKLLKLIATKEHETGWYFKTLKELGGDVAAKQLDGKILDPDMLDLIVEMLKKININHSYITLSLLAGLGPDVAKEEIKRHIEAIEKVFGNDEMVKNEKFGLLMDILINLLIFDFLPRKTAGILQHNNSEILPILETFGQTRNDGTKVSVDDVADKLKQLAQDRKRERETLQEEEKNIGEADWLARNGSVKGASLGAQEQYETAGLPGKLGLNWEELFVQEPKLGQIMERYPSAIKAFVILVQFHGRAVLDSKLFEHIEEKAPVNAWDVYDMLWELGEAVTTGKASEQVLDLALLNQIVEKAKGGSKYALHSLRFLSEAAKAGQVSEIFVDKELLYENVQIAGAYTEKAFNSLLNLGQAVNHGTVPEKILDLELLKQIAKQTRHEDYSTYVLIPYDTLRVFGEEVKAGKADEQILDLELLKQVTELPGKMTLEIFLALLALSEVVKSAGGNGPVLEVESLKQIAKAGRDGVNVKFAYRLLVQLINAKRSNEEFKKKKHELLSLIQTTGQVRNDGSVVSVKDVKVKLNLLKADWDKEFSAPKSEVVPEADWLTRQSVSGGLARAKPGAPPITGLPDNGSVEGASLGAAMPSDFIVHEILKRDFKNSAALTDYLKNQFGIVIPADWTEGFFKLYQDTRHIPEALERAIAIAILVMQAETVNGQAFRVDTAALGDPEKPVDYVFDLASFSDLMQTNPELIRALKPADQMWILYDAKKPEEKTQISKWQSKGSPVAGLTQVRFLKSNNSFNELSAAGGERLRVGVTREAIWNAIKSKLPKEFITACFSGEDVRIHDGLAAIGLKVALTRAKAGKGVPVNPEWFLTQLGIGGIHFDGNHIVIDLLAMLTQMIQSARLVQQAA